LSVVKNSGIREPVIIIKSIFFLYLMCWWGNSLLDLSNLLLHCVMKKPIKYILHLHGLLILLRNQKFPGRFTLIDHPINRSPVRFLSLFSIPSRTLLPKIDRPSSACYSFYNEVVILPAQQQSLPVPGHI